jgi:hypothetical protein
MLDPATTHVCALSYRYYPLLGSRRQFRLWQPKRISNLTDLLQYLRAHELTVVAVLNADTFASESYRECAEWLHQNPRLFSLLHADQTLSLFRVNRSALAEL